MGLHQLVRVIRSWGGGGRGEGGVGRGSGKGKEDGEWGGEDGGSIV